MYDAYTGSGNESVVRASEEFPLLMPRWGYVASAFVLFLIGFFGFFLNLLVILLMFKDRQLWTPLNMILFNLVCSDFSVSVLGNPFTLVSALFHRWVFGRRMCVLYGFFMALLGITSITTLTVLSFERYMMVTRPFSPRHLTPRSACLTILFIWSYSLALTTPPLFGWGDYVNEAANISCSVNWQEQTFNTLTYILFLFAMGQVVPCGVIGFSYYNIVRTMKENSLRMGRVNRAEAKVTVMVFIMIIAFMVAWTPYSVLALLEQFAEHGMVSPGVGVIPALVAKSSICYDPLIYVGMNTQFRASIKRLFGIHSKGGVSNAEQGFDNTVMSPAPRMSNADNEDNTILKVSISKTSKMHKKTCKTKGKKIVFIKEPRQITKYNQSDYNLYKTGDLATASKKERTSEIIRSRSADSILGDEEEYKCIEHLDVVTPKHKGDELKSEEVQRLDIAMNAYGDLYDEGNVYKNLAFEDINADVSGNCHNIDTGEITKTHKFSKMKHSASLEVKREKLNPKIRKISLQASFEMSRNTERNNCTRNTAVNKFLNRHSWDNLENFKTLLYTNDKTDNEEDSL